MASRYETKIRTLRERHAGEARTAISLETVSKVEASLSTIEQKTADSDRLLFDYFSYLIGELEKAISPEIVIYPVAFYNGQVESLEAMRQKVIELALAERAAVRARGRNSFGQIGDYFWENSEIEDLGEFKLLLDDLIGEAVRKFEINLDEWHNRVDLGHN
ncbi:hypothetical protein A3A84_04110 [Candidatus Collierbacteria bacterium RIFCSPLOWO2_01_FULL_50_23]|uniref:Uncharacterized protein n=1 Tax=Candidatus Collierbacteria bacterium RIFCSPHIGHO2_02_FULL_49_10 TaxID=1817723 RepID=A0A1F5EV20_9BACT|nr:MAG: hypothetical protein A3D09_03540 [Candidatus Collierbacteria bacterium RIFCSPHIGHO2_02_FULL_49_10]OGD73865.1 MAG: hypothetical protein A3A84_04110 [Candidatus Collierbacteria bacterium RIFCSPLOWO2_01_FULL_50_23]